MTNDEFDISTLERDLRDLPQASPPDGFSRAVMARLPDEAPRRGRLHRALLAPRTVRFRPLTALAAAACLVAVFGLGFISGRGPGGSAPRLAEASYGVGEEFLNAGLPRQALAHLAKAARLDPANARYAYAVAEAFRQLGNPRQEERTLLEAVRIDPAHVPAIMDLAHNALDAGRLENALKRYDEVLALRPGDPVALYNKGLALRRLGRVDEGESAWRDCVRSPRAGAWSYEAVARLNEAGDFSFRTHQIGTRRVILGAPDFTADAPLAPGDAATLADALRRSPSLVLHVVAFAAGDAALARERSLAVRAQILAHAPGVSPDRVRGSWFAQAEHVRLPAGDARLDQSMLFIGTPRHHRTQGGSTT